LAAAKKKTGGAGKKRGADPLTSFRMYEEIRAIVLIAIGAFLIFAMFVDKAGIVGDGVSYGLIGALGVMAYVLPFVLIAYAIAIFANKGYSISLRTHVFVAIMFVMLMLLISAFRLADGADPLRGADVAKVFETSANGRNGGVAGMYAGLFITSLIGKAGLFILSIAALAVSTLLLARTTLTEHFERIAKARADMRERREAREDELRRMDELATRNGRKAPRDHRTTPDDADTPEPEPDTTAPRSPAGGGMISLFGGLGRRRKTSADNIIDAVKNADDDVQGATGLRDAAPPGPPAHSPAEETIPILGIEPPSHADAGMGLEAGIMEASAPPAAHGSDDGALEGAVGEVKGPESPPAWKTSGATEKPEAILGIEPAKPGFPKKKSPAAYKLPPVDLLKKSPRAAKAESEKDIRAKARKLEEILRDFRVDASVLKVTVGPTVTRYEVEPDVGVKIQSIKSLESDLALRLEVKSVRVVPMPGQAVVGIEAYNAKRNLVTLREIIDSPDFMDRTSKIAFALGKNVSGDRIIADLSDMPHLLIAGTTGSGKSVCINSILLSILYKAAPDDVKLILIDPKVVELKPYNDIPHLLLPVVTSPERAATALGYAVTIMNERYAKFAEYNVRNLESYNELMLGDGRADDALPQIVIVIDELSDLMMIAPQKVQESISRLAAMARAAGMHLIVATQQPLASILTSVIKANIPSRIAFSVSANSASRVILDEPGAERLHGKGDMLFSPVGTREPMRVQGSFVSEAEVYKVTEFVKKEMDPEYSPDILDVVNGDITGDLTEDEDDLFRDAVEAVVAAKQASVSMLQRRFRIGYNRSARLVDMMEERGMVAPSDGTNKPRNVRMTADQLADDMAASGSGSHMPSGGSGALSEMPGRPPTASDSYTEYAAAPDVSGAEIAPVSHPMYGGIPGGAPAGDEPPGGDSSESADTPEPVKDIYDLINDDDPPFDVDDE
jgi:S-DNA-T family DNA segregation ATPase FtsK/SpoIIIE